MVNKETNIAPEIHSLGRSKTSERNERVNDATRVPLVVNYNAFLSGLGHKIHKNLCFSYQDEEVKQVFIPAPFASFLSVRTLRSHLVSAKVYPVGERLVWSRKFNKNPYKVCKNFIKTDTFQYFLIRRFIKSIIDLQVVMSSLPLVMLGLWYALQRSN